MTILTTFETHERNVGRLSFAQGHVGVRTEKAEIQISPLQLQVQLMANPLQHLSHSCPSQSQVHLNQIVVLFFNNSCSLFICINVVCE